MDFGIKRIETGVLLYLIKAHKLWRGKAESFSKFLADSQISGNGANQFIKVAEKFFFELGVRDDRLLILARCSMSTLVLAAEKANKGNIELILQKLDCLSSEDMKVELEKIDTDDTQIFSGVEVSVNLDVARQAMSLMSKEELIILRNELWAKTK